MIENLNEIKSRADIVEIIGAFVPVKKFGRSYKCVCPFHDEKTPSLAINEQRGLWHCFGCGAGGDVIKFVADFTKCDFTEAVSKVAQMSGIAVSESKNASGALRGATEFYFEFAEWLNSNLASRADLKEYLFRRGLDEADLAGFNIGFCPDNATTLAWLNFKNSRELAERLGVVKNGFCLFSERITFAFVQDTKIVGFSGRVTPNFKQRGDFIAPKYINSSESTLFHKADFLYNFSNARRAITDSGECFVCEGFFDAIALNKLGIKNAIATCGTAFGAGHLKKFARLNARLNFVFDNDEAGFEAARRASITALEAGFYDVRVGIFKREFRSKKDAGDILKAYAGIKATPALEAGAIYDFYSGFEYIARRELKTAKNTREAQNALNAAKTRAAQCGEELFRDEFERTIPAVFGVTPAETAKKSAPKMPNSNLAFLKMIKGLVENFPKQSLAVVANYYTFAFCATFAGDLAAYERTGELTAQISALCLDERVEAPSGDTLAELLRFFYCAWCDEQIAAAIARADFAAVVEFSEKRARAGG